MSSEIEAQGEVIKLFLTTKGIEAFFHVIDKRWAGWELGEEIMQLATETLDDES